MENLKETSVSYGIDTQKLKTETTASTIVAAIKTHAKNKNKDSQKVAEPLIDKIKTDIDKLADDAIKDVKYKNGVKEGVYQPLRILIGVLIVNDLAKNVLTALCGRGLDSTSPNFSKKVEFRDKLLTTLLFIIIAPLTEETGKHLAIKHDIGWKYTRLFAGFEFGGQCWCGSDTNPAIHKSSNEASAA
jgi:hypothetical protein